MASATNTASTQHSKTKEKKKPTMKKAKATTTTKVKPKKINMALKVKLKAMRKEKEEERKVKALLTLQQQGRQPSHASKRSSSGKDPKRDPNRLALMDTLFQARWTYGTRHDDYHRYHAFCSQRIRSLRAQCRSSHSLERGSGSKRGSGAVGGGKGKKVKTTGALVRGKKQAGGRGSGNGRSDAGKAATGQGDEGGDQQDGNADDDNRDMGGDRSSSGLAALPKPPQKRRSVVSADAVTDMPYLLMLAFQVERYWAYAMELQGHAKVVDAVAANQKRRHVLKKLKRAATMATALEALVRELAKPTPPPPPSSTASIPDSELIPNAAATTPASRLHLSGTDAMEVRAYAHVMRGLLAFEKRTWQEALDQLIPAKAIYERMVPLTQTRTEEALCHAAVDAIEPQIRYCRYQLAKKGQDVDALVRLIEVTAMQESGEMGSSRQGGSSGMESDMMLLDAPVGAAGDDEKKGGGGIPRIEAVEVVGERIPVRSKLVGQALAHVEELAASLPRLQGPGQAAPRLALLQTLISSLLQAEKQAHQDLEKERVAVRRLAPTATSQQYVTHLEAVLAYIALSRRVYTAHRNQLLLAAKAGDEAEDAWGVGLTPLVRGGLPQQQGTLASTPSSSATIASSSTSSAPSGSTTSYSDSTFGAGTSAVSATSSSKKPVQGAGSRRERGGTTGAGGGGPVLALQRRKRLLQERVRLIENVLQNLTEAAALPVFARHASFANAMANATLQFKALRCRDVGLQYVHEERWDEARFVFERGVSYLGEMEAGRSQSGHGNELADEAMQGGVAWEGSGNTPILPHLDQRTRDALRTDLAGRGVWIQALRFLREGSGGSKSTMGGRAGETKSKPAKQKRDKGPGAVAIAAAAPFSCSSVSLSSVPAISHAPESMGLVSASAACLNPTTLLAQCAPLPVPAKPVFFDLALNEIDFPDLTGLLPARPAASATPTTTDHALKKGTDTSTKAKHVAATKQRKGTPQRSAPPPERRRQEPEDHDMDDEEVSPSSSEGPSGSGLSSWLGGLWGRK